MAGVIERYKKRLQTTERTWPRRNAAMLCAGLSSSGRPLKPFVRAIALRASCPRCAPIAWQGATGADHAPPAYLAARCQVRLSQGASQTRVRLAVPRASTGRVRVDSLPTRFADVPRTAAPAARPRRRGRLAPLPFNMLSPSCARKRSSRDAIRRRARQSACLRKNAGMSYVSTPFSCSACTCEAAVSRELRQTAGVSNAP